MSGLRLASITKTFGDFAAVDGLDLDVREGEFITLLGPSGCGKTTTLRIIAGFLVPDTGEVFINGRPVNNLPPNRRNTGMCFQSYALFPHMTVYENVRFGLRMRKVPPAEQKKRIREVLAMVGLEELAGRKPSELSGGQQQRVALARAVVIEPDVLLFDEPLSNLDAKLREYVRVEIRNLQKRLGITSIYVTHDQAEALVISDRVVVMNRGQDRAGRRPLHGVQPPAHQLRGRVHRPGQHLLRGGGRPGAGDGAGRPAAGAAGGCEPRGGDPARATGRSPGGRSCSASAPRTWPCTASPWPTALRGTDPPGDLHGQPHRPVRRRRGGAGAGADEHRPALPRGGPDRAGRPGGGVPPPRAGGRRERGKAKAAPRTTCCSCPAPASSCSSSPPPSW